MDEAHITHDMLLTLAVAISAGVTLMVVAHRIHVSAIMLLLLGGVALGPEGAGIVKPDGLPTGVLSVIVSLAVGLILFEGGLTLDVKGFRAASGSIKRLLSIGVLTTWLATAAAIWGIPRLLGGTGFDVGFCVLCASLVIVTGPTVIAPLLKRIRVESRVHGILHWEGVLIDPIGVFIALLCFEWIDVGGSAAAGAFLARVFAGLAIGVTGGWGLSRLLKRGVIPREMINVFAIAYAMALFGLSEAIESETGLLTVTAAGFVLGALGSEELKSLRTFKAEITELMIGLLFILLAARLQIDQFIEFGAIGAVVVACVVFLVRPLNILLSTWGQDLRWQEKTFLSWVAPRGIVAASTSSLFGLKLIEHGKVEEGVFIEVFTYSVIASTVLLQAPTAGFVAAGLGLRRPKPRGWMIVGATTLARRLARFIERHAEVPVLLVDANARAVATARARGLTAVCVNALDTDTIEEHDEFLGVGNVLALTDNEELNVIVCQRWAEIVGRGHVLRWCSRAKVGLEKSGTIGTVVWPDLPKPSLVSMELDRGDARTTYGPTVEQDTRSMAAPLLSVVGDAILPDGRERQKEGQEVGSTIHVIRSANYLQRAVRRDLVLTHDGGTMDDVLVAMVDRVVDAVPDISRADLLQQLRANDAPASMVGKGAAVPHVYAQGLDSHVCAVALLRGHLDLVAPDGEPIQLVFLLVSPAGDPEGHIAVLSEIARVVEDDDVRRRLYAAATPEEFLTRVREHAHTGWRAAPSASS